MFKMSQKTEESGKRIKHTWGIRTVICGALLLALAAFVAGFANNGSGITALAASTPVTITKSGGWLESAYVEWSPTDAAGYNVYYKPAGAPDSEYIKIDTPLVRRYSTRFRADVLGLAAGNYIIKVVPTENGVEIPSLAAVTPTLAVKAHIREGFAFVPGSPMGTGSGGYNDNGTVPGNAQIVYVTAETVNTVTLGVKVDSGKIETGVGLANILYWRGKGYDRTPLIIRMIGQIKDTDFTGTDDKTGLNGDGYLQMKDLYNITLEGVGEDATIYGWGLLLKRAYNVGVAEQRQNPYYY